MTRFLRLLAHVPWIVVYLLVFLRELILANLRVAWEVVTPGLTLQPGIVAVPTECTTEWQMFVLANTLTMTPGTLSLEVDTDTNTLYVHSLYVPSREAFIADIQAIERVILKAMK